MGTAAPTVARRSIVAMIAKAMTAVSTEPMTSSQTSSMLLTSLASSRNRLTASPDDPGSRPAAGPPPVTSERRRLTRGTVSQPTHAPCH